jgi:starch synthase
MRLLVEPGGSGRSGLEAVLVLLGPQGVYIMLGSGDPADESFFVGMSARSENFIFLNGYSEECARALYANGDLFLMPSSFEPCGISQMLAMRDGQPCLAHAVGGLKDTVREGLNGFTFEGDSIPEQVDNLAAAFARASELKRGNPKKWRELCAGALGSRFSWSESVARYLEKLYAPTPH